MTQPWAKILVPIPQDDPEMSAVNETCASSLHGQFMPFHNGGGTNKRPRRWALSSGKCGE